MTDQTQPAPAEDDGASTRGRGRPSKFRPEFTEQARKLCAKGFRDVDLAEFFGVAVSTIYVWRGLHRDFAAATKVGKRVADAMVEEALFRRATGYSHDAVKHMVVSNGSGEGSRIEAVEYIEHYPPDTTAAIFWLKNRRPKEWRDRQEVRHAAGDTLVRFLADLDGMHRGIPGASVPGREPGLK